MRMNDDCMPSKVYAFFTHFSFALSLCAILSVFFDFALSLLNIHFTRLLSRPRLGGCLLWLFTIYLAQSFMDAIQLHLKVYVFGLDALLQCNCYSFVTSRQQLNHKEKKSEKTFSMRIFSLLFVMIFLYFKVNTLFMLDTAASPHFYHQPLRIKSHIIFLEMMLILTEIESQRKYFICVC